MTPLPPALIPSVPFQPVFAVMLGLLAASVVHLLLWRMRRERYLLLWGLAWIAFAVRYIPMLSGTPFDAGSTLSVSGTMRDLLFLCGAAFYTGRRWWRWLIVPAAVEILLILSGSLRHPMFGALARDVRIASSVIALAIVVTVLVVSQRPGRTSRLVSAAGLMLLIVVFAASPSRSGSAFELLAVLSQIGALAYVVGIAFAELDDASARRLLALKKLEGTMQHALRGHASVCAGCDRIEAADGAWRAPEAFVYSATNAAVTHGICPSCARREFGIELTDNAGES